MLPSSDRYHQPGGEFGSLAEVCIKLVCSSVVTVAVCLTSEYGAGAAAMTGTVARGVTAYTYDPINLSLVWKVHAEHIYVDHERRAFFRIGLLPLLVIEDVQVQLQSVECLTNALAELRPRYLPAGELRKLEMRNLEIMMLGETQPRLRATTARIESDGAIRLADVSVRDAVGIQQSFPKAILQIAGPRAGTLCCDFDDHPKALSVFQKRSQKTP